MAGLLAATIARLCEGQILELQRTFDVACAPRRATSRSIDGKTAALLATACRIGGIVGELPRRQIDQLTRFGHSYGMAFQIVDDILDVVATDEELGKPAGNDLVEGVYTLPVIRALAGGGPDAERLGELLGRTLSESERDVARDLVRGSGQIDSSLEVARGYADEAVASLDGLSGSEAGTALVAASDHLVETVRVAGRR